MSGPDKARSSAEADDLTNSTSLPHSVAPDPTGCGLDNEDAPGGTA